MCRANLQNGSQEKADLRKTVYQTASALAADRATNFLPIIVAQSLFIGAIAIATFRTAAAAKVSPDTLWINLEAHGIAYSSQYFWIIPAVFLGSVIGVSQTKDAIPRLLRRFQGDLDHLPLPERVVLPNNCLDGDQKRVFCKYDSWLKPCNQSIHCSCNMCFQTKAALQLLSMFHLL